MDESYSGWFQEGHYLSFVDQDVRYYYYVLHRDYATIRYEWEESVSATTESGPYTIQDLQPTKDNQLFQIIFGISRDVFVYQYLPQDVLRHGLPRRAQPSSTYRQVADYLMRDSPEQQPSWITEFFLIRPHVPYVGFSCYNPHDISLMPKLRFYVAKLQLEPLGSVNLREGSEPEAPKTASGRPISRYNKILNLLQDRVIRHRPITLLPVRAPATD